MEKEINNIRNELIAQSLDVTTQEEWDELKLSYLGRNGKLTKIIKSIKDFSPEQKREAGKLLNQTKQAIEEILEEARTKIDKSAQLDIDPTTPVTLLDTGHLHLITQAIEDISRIFERIGFVRRRYPEVDWDYYAFEALNFSPNHPARDNWETYWIDSNADKNLGPMLLTPHTSNGQIHEMKGNKPPFRMINIAKTYRRQSDVSHTPMFHQFEGLFVDEHVSIAQLKWTLEYFAREYFGADRTIRLRPHDFEFTEPSFEVDISCDICGGTGKLNKTDKCRLCKDGWLELAGAGMVHPNVLIHCDIDPKKYSGFAFGAGVERVLMMRKGLKIDDLRLLYSTDTQYLQQF